MKKNIVFLSLFCLIVSFQISAKVGVKKQGVVLDSPVLGLIDGKSFGMSAKTFGLLLQLRRKFRKRIYGTVIRGNKRVGMYRFGNKNYTLIELEKIEKDRGMAQADLSQILKEVKADFFDFAFKHFYIAKGMKAPLLVIIKEFCDKKGLEESFLLSWENIQEGKEEQNVRNIGTFKIFTGFYKDMSDFLEALARSCPKAKQMFIDMIENAKQSR